MALLLNDLRQASKGADAPAFMLRPSIWVITDGHGAALFRKRWGNSPT
jgi:hypothetical protein